MRELLTFNQIYPLTIIADRYSGTYSGGKYTAWNTKYWEIPDEIDSDDVTCMEWWIANNKYNIYIVGKGNTPDEAAENLLRALIDRENIRRNKDGDFWF